MGKPRSGGLRSASWDLPAKVPKRSGEQIEALARITPAAHRAKQQRRLRRQTQSFISRP
jgi:hypothetical protein